MHVNRRWIEDHIPHAGRMCLLEEVLEWDSSRIRCRSGTHRSKDNPLRAFGRLGAACGLEYAAQAMAIHGALVAEGPVAEGLIGQGQNAGAGARIPVGYIASVRGVTLLVDRLDEVQADLIATAQRVTSDARTALYEFLVCGADRPLVSGRATIVFDIGAHSLTDTSRP